MQGPHTGSQKYPPSHDDGHPNNLCYGIDISCNEAAPYLEAHIVGQEHDSGGLIVG